MEFSFASEESCGEVLVGLLKLLNPLEEYAIGLDPLRFLLGDFVVVVGRTW